MKQPPAWRTALSLFTIIPVRSSGKLGEGDAARAILWMPVVGLLLGLLGAAVLLGVDFLAGISAAAHGHDGPHRLLGAALALTLTALLTGALHLDGLADTADGLGSRRPPATALEIMRRSDIGPMGVTALLFTLLIQSAALASLPDAKTAALAFTLTQVTARVSVVLATGSPAARPGGFGALVAAQTKSRDRTISVVLLCCAVVGAGFGLGGAALAWRGLVAAAIGLVAGTGTRLIAVRRLGGTTGDVFGAILELTATATLITCALLS